MIQLSHRIFYVGGYIKELDFQALIFTTWYTLSLTPCSARTKIKLRLLILLARKESRERERGSNLNFIDDSLSCWRKEMTCCWHAATSATAAAASASLFFSSFFTSWYESRMVVWSRLDCWLVSISTPPLQCQHAINRTAPPCSSSVKTSRNRYRPFQAQPTCSFFLWGAVSKRSSSRSVARSVKMLLNKWIADWIYENSISGRESFTRW